MHTTPFFLVHKTFAVSLILGEYLYSLSLHAMETGVNKEWSGIAPAGLKTSLCFCNSMQVLVKKCDSNKDALISSRIQPYHCTSFLYKPADIYTGTLCRRPGSFHHYCKDLDSMDCLKIEDTSVFLRIFTILGESILLHLIKRFNLHFIYSSLFVVFID